MPLHRHILSIPEELNGAPNVDGYPTPQLEQGATENDPLLLPKDEHTTPESETRTLLYACLLTTFFFFVELVGGYLAGSLAIMSDAAHLLSDLAGFAISLLAVAVSRLPPNAQMSFGFARAEVLGAFVSILFIWALTAVLIVFAIERLFHPSPVHGPTMLVLGIVGLLVNIALGCVLGHDHHGHGHGHTHHDHDHSHDDVDYSHDHDHTHQSARQEDVTPHPSPDMHEQRGDSHAHTPRETHLEDQHPKTMTDLESGDHQDHHGAHGHDSSESPGIDKPSWHALLFNSDKKSVNLRAAYLHVLGDALQNVGVIVAAIIMTLHPGLSFIDPLCTLLFAGIVLVTTKGLARETMNVLMEGTPPTVKLDDIHAALIRINGVARIGDLHAWSISPRQPALSVHLYQTMDTRGHDLVKDAQKVLADRFGIFHATIQVNCDTLDCCDDELYFEATSGQKKCISYNRNRASNNS